jgi:hypothetical protein
MQTRNLAMNGGKGKLTTRGIRVPVQWCRYSVHAGKTLTIWRVKIPVKWAKGTLNVTLLLLFLCRITKEKWINSTLEVVKKVMEAEGMENLLSTAKEEGSVFGDDVFFPFGIDHNQQPV